MAFQIQDDILDLFGTVENLGKDIGSDFINDKKSILSVLAKDLHLPKLSEFSNEQDFINEIKNILMVNKIHDKATEIKKNYEQLAELYLTNLNHSIYKDYLLSLIYSLKKRIS
jgi:geranylgeranyl pyrophosphate synthase